MADVSSRPEMRLASVTLLIRSFMSPGSITSWIPNDTTLISNSPARRHTDCSISRAIKSLSDKKKSNLRTSSVELTAFRASALGI